MTTLGIDAQEIFAQCEVTISKLAAKYRIHFGDEEAAVAEAYIIVAERLAEGNPPKTNIAQWAGYQVSNRFRQMAYNVKDRRENVARMDFFGEVETECHDFNLLEFLDELSNDAQYLAEIVLYPHEAFNKLLAAEPKLRTVKAYVQGKWGWSNSRFNAAVAEIRRALVC